MREVVRMLGSHPRSSICLGRYLSPGSSLHYGNEVVNWAVVREEVIPEGAVGRRRRERRWGTSVTIPSVEAEAVNLY